MVGGQGTAVEYSSAHIFLITSISEGMPLRLLEASACGLPVVASAIPGVVDVVETLGHGYLVRSSHVESFIRGILHYYNLWTRSPDKYYEIRKALRERTIANYDWNVILDKIESMFKQVLARHRA